MSRDRRPSSVAASPAVDAAPLTGGLAGYRLLRRIASGDRADVYLAAAHSGAAEPDAPTGFAPRWDDSATPSTDPAPPSLVTVRVYPANVPDDSVTVEIEAMSAHTGGALPALFDVAGLDDGRCCLAVERIPGPSVARLLTERTLSIGEAITILAPIAAAVADLAEAGFVHTRLCAADLLLDDAGRPRLIGLGALRRLPGPERAAERTALLKAGHVALADLLDELADAVRPAGALDAAIDLVRGRLEARPFRRCESELERMLFQAAVPEPLAGVAVRTRTTRLPARVTAPVPFHPIDDVDPLPEAVVGPVARRAGGIRAFFGLAQLPDDLTERVARATDAAPARRLRDRIEGGIRARRGALTVGALVGGGALVLLLTLLPPATADDAHPADGAEPSASAVPASEAPAPAGGATPPTSPPAAGLDSAGDDDPAAAARELLERRAECFATLDLACLDEVLQSGSAIETTDRAAMLAVRDGAGTPPEELDAASATVTAEMGDAVLVGVARIEPGREPASLLLVRGEAGWRLREVFD